MRGMWVLRPSRFPAKVCDDIIALGNALPIQKAEVGDVGNYDDCRRARLAWAHPEMPEWGWVRNLIMLELQQANASVFDVDIRYLPAMQFTIYDGENKGWYERHIDNFFNQSAGAYDRKLSLVAQLTDPAAYEGGVLDLDLPNNDEGPDAAAMKQRGSVIIFPSFIPHEVSPVTSGTRYSLVAWMEGPHWR
jgi:PKHD-type hydroxylase